jgi:hypothetical protein
MVKGEGFGDCSLEFGFQELGFGIEVKGFGVEDSWSRAHGLGFKGFRSPAYS